MAPVRGALREAWRTYRVASEVADSYGGLTLVLVAAQACAVVAGAAALATLALVPIALLVALVFPPAAPVAGALALAAAVVAVAAFSLGLWLVLRVLPRRARALLASVGAARAHADERYTQLRDLAGSAGERRAPRP